MTMASGQHLADILQRFKFWNIQFLMFNKQLWYILSVWQSSSASSANENEFLDEFNEKAKVKKLFGKKVELTQMDFQFAYN